MAMFSCCGPPSRASLRRGQVVDAARKLFAQNGFHATGVAQIARASGVAVGQLYRDFAAKEDIVAAIVTSDCETFMARDALRRAVADGDEAAVWAWLRGFVAPGEDSHDDRLFAEIVAEAARNQRIAAIFAATRDDAAVCLSQALAMLAPGDSVDDRRTLLADLILTQSLGIMQHRLLAPGIDTRRLADAVISVIGREIEAMRAPPVAAAD